MRQEREHNEQCVVINWCELNKKKYPCLGYIYAIPNMGKHHVAFRVKQAKEGLKKGMLDLCLPWPKKDFTVGEMVASGDFFVCCGLYIEMKIKPNSLSPEQKEWIAYFIDVGYEVIVAWSAEEAIQGIKDFVNPDEKNWIDFQ